MRKISNGFLYNYHLFYFGTSVFGSVVILAIIAIFTTVHSPNMSFKKPKLIDHDHILESILEIRFIPKDKDVFVKLLMLFKGKYPEYNFTSVDVPVPLRQADVNLRYQPKGRLSSDDYLISFGDVSISFNCTGAYKSWNNFFPFIEENLLEVQKADVISKIERIGLRYINFFESKGDINEILNVSFKLDVMNPSGLEQDQTTYHSVLVNEEGSINLRISNKARVQNKSEEGIIFDIDSFREKDLPEPEGKELYNMINLLHERETDVFFSLLNKNFLESLNPEI